MSQTSGFTEEEYERELELHHIEIPGKQNASSVYKKLPQEVKDNPRSGVFRDYIQYGVFPARVVVQYAVITLPFILRTFSREQILDEIVEQDQDIDKKESHFDAAYRLIQTYKKRKKFIPHIVLVRKYLSALNLYYYKFGGFDKLCKDFLIPKTEDLKFLAPLIPEKIIMNELHERYLNDPEDWGKCTSTIQDVPDEFSRLLISLMTQKVLTSDMRGIVDWFKKAYRREKLYMLLQKITEDYKYLIPIVKIKA